MHRVYKKGEVNDRHFEVILRAMRSPKGAPVGVSQAVFARKGFLAGASFQGALDVLAEAAVTQEEDSLKGPKERLMLGKLMRQVKRVRHSKGEASGRS